MLHQYAVWSSTSKFPTQMDPAYLAQSSIGQYEVAATPLQMHGGLRYREQRGVDETTRGGVRVASTVTS